MEWVKLGDIAEIRSGGTPKRSEYRYWTEGTIPWVKISDLKSKYVTSTEEQITPLGLENSSAKLFSPGTILYTIFASIGEVGVLSIEATTNQAIVGINLKDDAISTDYLYYYLLSIRSRMKSVGRGVAQNNVNMTMLRDVQVPIQSKENQISIVHSLMSLEDLIAKRREQIDALDALVDSVFYDLIFNESDEQIPLGELMSDFLAGKSLAGEKPSQFRVLKTSCVYSGYFDENEWKFLPVAYKPKEEHIVKSGDILVSRMNTEELVGASAYVDKDYDDLAIPDRLWILRTNEGVSPVFLWKFFQTDLYRGLISRIATGTSGSMKNISKKNFSQIQVPLPKLEVQNRFADYVTSIEAQKESLRTSLAELETLFDALMQAAFSGHLNQS